VLTCTAFLLFICTAACALLYHTSVQDATNRRLRANLVRTSSEEGRDVGDASLKTLSYSGQQKHPAGITTEDLSAELAAGKPLNMIDVREAEEAERGRVLGSWHRRYPDLFHDRSGLVQEGMKTVLLCYSGNRSSELVDAFRVDGISCFFMIGGYEKWIAENRQLDLGASVTRAELRELPDFPNKEVLLDTPDVEAALAEQGAVFVDVPIVSCGSSLTSRSTRSTSQAAGR
jgi:rhodanese-related sulfurtransferase